MAESTSNDPWHDYVESTDDLLFPDADERPDADYLSLLDRVVEEYGDDRRIGYEYE